MTELPGGGGLALRRGTNGPRVKKHNEALVLDLVRSHGPVARAWIAQRLGLEFQTVSNICSRLIAAGLLLEDGVVDGPQRQSRAVVVNPLAVYSVGVELNRSDANAVLISFDGNVLGRRQVLVSGREPFAVLDEVAGQFAELMQEVGIDEAKVAGVGISVPGPIDRHTGTILAPTNFELWHDIPVRGELQQRTTMPVFVENTATSAALGEQWTGIGSDDFVYVYLGVGIGLGAIAGGRALHGAFGNAGEFAHLVADPDGPLCVCGQRGCLVQYATPKSLLHLMQRAWLEERNAHPGSTDPMPLDAAEFIRPDAPSWLTSAAQIGFDTVGRTIARLATIFDPEAIVFGGPTTELLGNQFVQSTVTALDALPSFGRRRPDIMLAAATSDAGPVGAASLPLHASYSPYETA